MSSPRSIPTVDLRDSPPTTPPAGRAADALRLGFDTTASSTWLGTRRRGRRLRAYDSYQALARRPEAEGDAGGEPVVPARWTRRTPKGRSRAASRISRRHCRAPPPRGAKRQYPQIHADNVWPEAGAVDADAFRARYLAMGKALHGATSAARRCLGLDEATFVERIDGGAHVTRLLRYLRSTRRRWGADLGAKSTRTSPAHAPARRALPSAGQERAPPGRRERPLPPHARDGRAPGR